jgi:glycerol-3-phosphate acyltransferase PlsY
MSPLLDAALRMLLAYLLGSVLGSMVMGRLRGGVDIRRMGSGNAGGTNALRTQGKLFGSVVLCIDFSKGWVASGWLPYFAWPGVPPPVGADITAWLPALCGAAALLGHIYPVWFGFRGGKGIATGAGVVAGMKALLLAPALLLWIVVVLTTGFVGLASICAAFALPLATLLLQPEPLAPPLAFTGTAAVVVLYTHRSNIRRMLAGTEARTRWRRASRSAS